VWDLAIPVGQERRMAMSKSKHARSFKERHLDHGEVILAAADGWVGKIMGSGDDTQHNGALVVTDRRVVFHRRGMFGEMTRSVDLDSVASVERSSSFGTQTITVRGSGTKLVFKSHDSDAAAKCADVIRRRGEPEGEVDEYASLYEPPRKKAGLGTIVCLGIFAYAAVVALGTLAGAFVDEDPVVANSQACATEEEHASAPMTEQAPETPSASEAELGDDPVPTLIAPEWYEGEKPWREISEQGRRELLIWRREYDRAHAAAKRPPAFEADPAVVARGERLVADAIDRRGLSSFYKKPGQFGPKTVVWIAEDDWRAFTPVEKDAIRTWMRASHRRWGIGVGRVKGIDVLADRVVESWDD